MALPRLTEFLQFVGEIPDQQRLECRIVRRLRCDERGEEVELRVRHDHGELWPRQAEMLLTQFSERLRRGQALHDAVQFPLGFKGFDEAFMTVEVGGRGCLHDGQRGCLIVIVLQHEMADVIGHRG